MLTEVIANRANENAANAGRKTISPQDVLKALDDLEFGDFKPRLEAELASSFPLSFKIMAVGDGVGDGVGLCD